MAISLASLQRNQAKPPRMIFYGPAGVGKTTLACSAPAPVVIQTEDGLGTLDATAFPLAQSYDEVIQALAALGQEDHEFQTVVIDSLDWLEPLIWQHVCAKHDKQSIEDFGYGKGYVEALAYWREFFDYTTALRDHRGMTVIMTAHSQVIRVEDPEHDSFDAHTLKLHKRAAAVCEEFSDVIAYTTLKTMVRKEDKGFGQQRSRAISTGEREMRLVNTPAYLAKNRYDLPDVLPLAWDALAEHLPTIGANRQTA